MNPQTIGFSLLILSVGLLVGKIIRVKVRWVQRLFLPSTIVGGVILLVLGPQVLGRVPGPGAKRACSRRPWSSPGPRCPAC